MVNFSQQLRALIIRPWQGYYIDYAHLKRVLLLFRLPDRELAAAHAAVLKSCSKHQGMHGAAVLTAPSIQEIAEDVDSDADPEADVFPVSAPPQHSVVISIGSPDNQDAAKEENQQQQQSFQTYQRSAPGADPDADSVASRRRQQASSASAEDQEVSPTQIHQLFLTCLEDNLDRVQLFFSSRLSFYAGLIREMELQYYTSNEANTKISERAQLLTRISSSLQRLQHDLNMLASFAEVNVVACHKILKKLDKYSGSQVQQQLFRWIREQRCFCDPHELEELSMEARRFAIEVNRLVVNS